jgi:hypothetical protein
MTQTKERETALLYTRWVDTLADFTFEQLGKLYTAALIYVRTGSFPEHIKLNEVERMAFKFMQRDLDITIEQYDAKCERNRENIKKRWQKVQERSEKERTNTTEYNRIQSNTKNTTGYDSIHTYTHTKTETDTQTQTESSNEDINKKKKFFNKENKERDFEAPTVEEVQKYINDNRLTGKVDAQEFVDYYTCIGWMVGRNPMKNWKAAARAWERRRDRVMPQAKQQLQKSGYSAAGIELGDGEYLRPDGTRTYGSGADTVPDDAPTRPAKTYWWDGEEHRWSSAI